MCDTMPPTGETDNERQRTEVTKLLTRIILQAIAERVEYAESLKILGVLCVTVDDQQPDVVIKLHSTLKKVDQRMMPENVLANSSTAITESHGLAKPTPMSIIPRRKIKTCDGEERGDDAVSISSDEEDARLSKSILRAKLQSLRESAQQDTGFTQETHDATAMAEFYASSTQPNSDWLPLITEMHSTGGNQSDDVFRAINSNSMWSSTESKPLNINVSNPVATRTISIVPGGNEYGFNMVGGMPVMNVGSGESSQNIWFMQPGMKNPVRLVASKPTVQQNNIQAQHSSNVQKTVVNVPMPTSLASPPNTREDAGSGGKKRKKQRKSAYTKTKKKTN